jgi:Fructose-2,6-bisphosphatase
METRLYMVRHAESPFVFGEEKSRGLSEQGNKDAARVAETLRGVDVHYIASSSYARAVQTVEPLARLKNLPIVTYDALRERPIKGLDRKASWETLVAAIEKSFDDVDYALEGGETTREAQRRAIPVIEQLLADYAGKHIVIGTHGNIMTAMMHYYDRRYGFAFWKRTTKPDIYEMAFKGSELTGIRRLWSDSP